MISISTALFQAVQQLQLSSETATLDAEILLAHVLQVPRSFLYAWPERELTTSQHTEFNLLLQRRCQKEPIAYLTGHQEFWSLDLIVTPDTLIPRAETELIVELVLKYLDNSAKQIADLGTGSGAVALALASERPLWEIYATDRYLPTLNIARYNAARLNLSNVVFSQGNWFEALPQNQFDAIISNPPYIAKNDPELMEEVNQFQPREALFSSEEGLHDISHIIQKAQLYLKIGGYLFLEHGHRQGALVNALLSKSGYSQIESFQDLAGLDRVAIGRKFV